MQIVEFPAPFIEAHLSELRGLFETGQIAESFYVRQSAASYVPGKQSIPVNSGGAAIFALLAYQKFVRERRIALVQSNTMRALYTIPTLLNLKTVVVDSTYADFMSMSPESLEVFLDDADIRRSGVVLYSVIGGYLAPSFTRVVELCSNAGVPVIVDAAHGHYMNVLAADPWVDIAYSYYATKVLPAGEGGLVTTSSAAIYDWVRRFVMYDRFANELEVGLNLRASEPTAALIHRLMTDAGAKEHFQAKRVALAREYEALCLQYGIDYLKPEDALEYNGYKFIIRDTFEEVGKWGTRLTEHPATSGVFDTDVLGRPSSLPHWCPPTYTCLSRGA